MEDDNGLRELLRKLEQQHAEASTEERERAFEIASGNGDYLMIKFALCMKRILARPDLAPDIKTGAEDNLGRFMELFDATKRWHRKAAAHAFELAEAALNTGLRVGAGPEEAERIIRQARSDAARTYGDIPKTIPWVPYAQGLAGQLTEKDRSNSDSWIAIKLAQRMWKTKPARWEGEIPDCPGHETLRKFVGKWRKPKD
jgi:hypothetical protein